jgi:tetraacyldisaccharide 4'-kinase
MHVGAWTARRLERGEPAGVLANMASRAWAATVSIERPLRWRSGATVIVVGGSTLGGSGKTPLAIACAQVLRQAGRRVALVGHGYRAHPGPPRFVSVDDDVRAVGDEALECAARLSADGVPVAVAETRQAALDLALDVADVAVVDGPCQTRPRRASLSLLAVDASAPWGSGLCPPAGDLRAPVPVLLAAADRLVAVGSPPFLENASIDHASVASAGASLDGRLLGWDELRGLRIGLYTAIARPHRVALMLEKNGVRPVVTFHGPNHRAVGPGPRPSPALDLWLCTQKCIAHLGPGRPYRGGVPVAALDYSLTLGKSLARALLDPYATRP